MIPRFCIVHLFTTYNTAYNINAHALTHVGFFCLACEGEIIVFFFLENESRDLTSIASLSLNTAAITFFLYSEMDEFRLQSQKKLDWTENESIA